MTNSADFSRRPTVTEQISISDKIFATGRDRRLAATIDDGLAEVEQRLHKELQFADVIASQSARYLFEAGGKRVRPALTLLVSQLGEGVSDQVLTAAMAIEITHLASLYHDDVMDDADMRRGVPSAHMVWGNSVAILTGDVLFARASKLISSLGQRAIELQADTFERLCMGQLHETVGPKAGEDPQLHYLQVLADKTGSLIAAAAEMGIIFSDAPDEYRNPVLKFGEKIGVAFQLVDDIIDLTPVADDDASQTGKAQGTDVRMSVATLPMLLLREMAQTDEGSRLLCQRLDDSVVDTQPPTGSDLLTQLYHHEATVRTRQVARTWAAEAVDALAPLPEGSVKKALVRFADSIVERSA